MRNGKLVVAQIGCGKFAEHEDLPNISSLDTVLLKWVCDLDRKRAEEMKEQFNAEKVTSDFKEICADPEVDLIKIATSHEIHLPIVECAAAAGKHICDDAESGNYPGYSSVGDRPAELDAYENRHRNPIVPCVGEYTAAGAFGTDAHQLPCSQKHLSGASADLL